MAWYFIACAVAIIPQQEVTQSEVTQSEVTQSEVTQSEFTQSEFTQSEFTQSEFTQSEFTKLHADLQPEKAATWRTIAWQTSLIKAQNIAARDNKPIFIWAMDGHPLGCT